MNPRRRRPVARLHVPRHAAREVRGAPSHPGLRAARADGRPHPARSLDGPGGVEASPPRSDRGGDRGAFRRARARPGAGGEGAAISPQPPRSAAAVTTHRADRRGREGARDARHPLPRRRFGGELRARHVSGLGRRRSRDLSCRQHEAIVAQCINEHGKNLRPEGLSIAGYSKAPEGTQDGTCCPVSPGGLGLPLL